jgi:hypothetical protein
MVTDALANLQLWNLWQKRSIIRPGSDVILAHPNGENLHAHFSSRRRAQIILHDLQNI